jgi:hypothetical protein
MSLCIHNIGDFTPEEVLSYYDEPLLFTFKTTDSELFLACCSLNKHDCEFFAVKTFPYIISSLVNGKISVRSILCSKSYLYVIDTDCFKVPKKVYIMEVNDIPEDYLPKEGIKVR